MLCCRVSLCSSSDALGVYALSSTALVAAVTSGPSGASSTGMWPELAPLRG